jgi:hypothetical protein
MVKASMFKKIGIKKVKKPVIESVKPKVKKKIIFPQHNGMNLLTDDSALLLAEACKLDKQKKAAEKRLKKVKEILNLTQKGDYTNKAGDIVKISVSAKKSDIDTLTLYNEMKKKKIESRFWACVKAQLTPLKKVLPETEIAKLQFDLDDVIKHTFL